MKSKTCVNENITERIYIIGQRDSCTTFTISQSKMNDRQQRHILFHALSTIRTILQMAVCTQSLASFLLSSTFCRVLDFVN